MRIILLRHGATLSNQASRYLGRTDEPLSKLGIKQSEKAGSLTEIKRVYLSPLSRTKDTAAICFPNAKTIIVEDLTEMDFGDFEGRTAEEMKNDPSYNDWLNNNCESQCPHGESFLSLKNRVKKAFINIVEDVFLQGLDSAAIVAHGGSVMAIMASFADPWQPYFSWHVPNCQGYELLLHKEKWQNNPIIDSYRRFEQLTWVKENCDFNL